MLNLNSLFLICQYLLSHITQDHDEASYLLSICMYCTEKTNPRKQLQLADGEGGINMPMKWLTNIYTGVKNPQIRPHKEQLLCQCQRYHYVAAYEVNYNIHVAMLFCGINVYFCREAITVARLISDAFPFLFILGSTRYRILLKLF